MNDGFNMGKRSLANVNYRIRVIPFSGCLRFGFLVFIKIESKYIKIESKYMIIIKQIGISLN